MKECLFCNIATSEIIAENEFAFSIKDSFPVTEGHCLIIPKDHKKDYFHLSPKEKEMCFEILDSVAEDLKKNDSSIDGFNIGMNCGESSGQSIFHCHIHLIPRRMGDCQQPRGGVRGVIPEKQNY